MGVVAENRRTLSAFNMRAKIEEQPGDPVVRHRRITPIRSGAAGLRCQNGRTGEETAPTIPGVVPGQFGPPRRLACSRHACKFAKTQMQSEAPPALGP